MKRNRSLKRFMVVSLVLVSVCVSLVLTIMAISLIRSSTDMAYTNYENAMNQGYNSEIKSQVQSSIAVMQHYYDEFKKGTISEDEAKNHAKETIRSMRYRDDNSGYMWIDATDYTLVMHPILPQNEGQNRYNLEDQNGVMIIQEIMKTVSKGDGGYNQFYFTKADGVTVALKVAYSQEFKPWGWVVTTGNYVDDMEQDMIGVKNTLNNKLQTMIITMIISAVVMACIAFVAALIDGNYIVKPLKQIEQMAKRISEGDISEDVNVTVGNEIGKTADSLNIAQNNIKELIANISEVSGSINEVLYNFSGSFNQMSASINDVSVAVDDIAQNITSQADVTKSATNDVDIIGDGILHTENEVKVLTENAKNMQGLGEKSMHALNDLVDISNDTKVQIDEMFHQTERTNESVNKIKDVTNIINDIAEQTDLLALNASIEAARVGEAGKGFAVVAEQIGNLARQSGENVVEIGNVIEELLSNSERSLETMQAMMEHIKTQYEYIYATKNDVEELNGSLQSCVNSVGVIENMTHDIEIQRQNITEVLSKLNSLAQDNAASTQETSAMSEELTATVDSSNSTVHSLEEKVDTLVQSVGKFKI